MFFLVFLALAGISSCMGQYNYHAVQGKPTLTVLPGNEYTRLSFMENGYPSGIEYLVEITESTGLMVRVVFGNADGPLDAKNANDTRMNICDILDRALDDPDSSQARYNMPESLGLTTTRCPIEKGIKVLSPYNFPTEFTTKDLGCGERYYEMRVETPEQDLDSEAIMELHVELELTKENETCTENSSSALLGAPLMASLTFGWCVFALNNRIVYQRI